MSTRKLLTVLLLVVLADLTMLAVGIFLGQPKRVGKLTPHLEVEDLGFLAVPARLTVAAASTVAPVLLRRPRN